MQGQLNDTFAIVTAAGQGIGRATAVRLAAEGARVLALDINPNTLATLAGETDRITTAVVDATDAGAVRAAIERLATVDVLVNAVGFVHHGTILECTPEEWDRSFTINVKSAYTMISAVLPKMIAAKRGSIVNVASIASSIRAFPSRAVYGSSKAALIGLTKSVAVDYVKDGIRCNAVCPGTIETPSLEERIHAFADPDAARAAFIARQPMGRLGRAEEIAAACCYLASPESSYVTGTTLIVDGAATA